MVSLFSRVWKHKMLFIMRLTFSICLFCVLQSFAIGTYSQNIRLSINQKNISIESALQLIEDKTDYYFMYSALIVDVKRTVDIDATNKLVPKILDDIFKGTDISYKIEGRLIALSKNGETSQIEQSRSISGKITDSTGALLPGVSVVVKGTTTGTITDGNGNYTLANVPANATLLFSFVGMKTQEVLVTGKTNINITMTDETVGIEEVVAIGYGVQKKSVITGAISGTNSKELEDQSVYRVEQALQGRTSGVSVIAASGQPGEWSTVRVRGTTSINNSDPLYVVDGTPITGNIDYLSKSDIESIEVLKDAASSAIYGARAAAGVILITTKKGKSGSTRVRYEGTFGIQSPERKLDLCNAQEYSTLYNEAITNDNSTLSPISNGNSLGKGTDWQNVIFSNNSKITNHELSISGGSDKATIYSSFNYLDQEGIVMPDVSNYKRYGLRVNADYKLSSWLKVGENISYTYTKRRGIDTNTNSGGYLASAINLDPITPLVITDPNIANAPPYSNHIVMRDENGNPYGISKYVGREMVNPLAKANTQEGNYTSAQNIIGNFFVELQPIKNLYLKSTVGTGFIYELNESFLPEYFLNATVYNSTTFFYRGAGIRRTWSLENTASYKLKTQKHDFDILLGTGNYVDNDYKTVAATYYNVPINNFNDGSLNWTVAGENRLASGYDGSLHKVNSVYGRLIYNYDEKYLFTGILRRDGSSRFGNNNKFGYFPSASIGWVVSKENFWTKNRIIDFLKVRGSYGVTGSDNIGDFMYASSMRSDNFYYTVGSNAVIGHIPSALANPYLKWEETKQTDIGIEATLFGDVRFVFDYFKKTTSDMLMTIQLPVYAGNTGLPSGNVASMENSGYEMELNYRKQVGQVGLDISGNISYVKNKVTDLGETQYLTGPTMGSTSWELTRTQVGIPYASFYGFVVDGIFQNQNEINAYTNKMGELIQPKAVPGDFKWRDTNNDGSITNDDRVFLGNSIPKWTYGLNISASYKNFDFNLFLQGAAGNKIYQALRRVDVPTGNWQTEALGRWHGEGTSDSYPRLTFADLNGNYARPSAFHLSNGAYLRIKSVQFGYTLPKTLISKFGIDKIRTYINVANLFTLTKYSGYDPEIGGGSAGIDQGIYPQARTCSIGLSASF